MCAPNGEVVGIDQKLCVLMNELWKAGVETMYSCEGGLQGTVLYPAYIVMDDRPSSLAALVDLIGPVWWVEVTTWMNPKLQALQDGKRCVRWWAEWVEASYSEAQYEVI